MSSDTPVNCVDFSHAHSQDQSLLYSAFPPEVRLVIFELAFVSYPNPEKPYPFRSFWCRPGYTAPKKTDLALLRACKKVYLEAKHLIWLPSTGNNEEAFWWGDGRSRPPEHREMMDGDDIANECNHPLQSLRTKAFTTEHWSKITKVHIFSEMQACIQSTFKWFFEIIPSLQPKVIQLTIRYTDWWFWDRNDPLKVEAILPERYATYLPASCETFILELETIESKKNQLEEQVGLMFKAKERWKWLRTDIRYLALDETIAIKDWEWIAPTVFIQSRYAIPYDHHPPGEEMKLVVKVLTFNIE